MESFFNQSDENDASFRFLAEANKKSEWIWQFFLKFVLVGCLVNETAMTLGSVLICLHLKGEIDVDSLYAPIKVM